MFKPFLHLEEEEEEEEDEVDGPPSQDRYGGEEVVSRVEQIVND